MRNFVHALEMRSVIALVSVIGAIGLAVAEPEYGTASISILSTAVGGYFGQLVGHNKDAT